MTLQSPIGSGFGPASTAADVIADVDLSGKNALVTGGAVGIGLETTRALRTAGAIVDSNFKRYTPPEVLTAFGLVDDDGNAIIDPANSRKTIEQGAATTVWCATTRQLDALGGLYAQDCDIAPLVDVSGHVNIDFGSPPLGVMPYAVDPDTAERLWTLSEELTGARV